MAAAPGMEQRYWLMKAEPDSRIVKGKDVKFSVDDFESVGSTPWEGVRNYEARNLMKEMVLGDKILFYHSNCKNPENNYLMTKLSYGQKSGIAGFAEVTKEAYPDYTAWDSSHPYFDEKSDKDNPKWFMVDAKFVSRARHFVPLSLLRHLADLPSAEPPEAVSYAGEDGINAIKVMPLVTRGRLSVQRVPENCWDVIRAMAEKGGWDNMSFEKKKTAKARHPAVEARPTSNHRTDKPSVDQRDVGDVGVNVTKQQKERVPHQVNATGKRKRKASLSNSLEDKGQTLAPPRRSLRRKR